MKLELKNVKIHDDMSEETICFSARLYIDGKFSAICKNSGMGDDTRITYMTNEAQTKMFDYCRENPVIHYFENKRSFTYKNPEARIDELLMEYMSQKELIRLQKNHLCLHEVASKDPKYLIDATLKKNKPINELMESEIGRAILKNDIKAIRLKGYEIMNTNIDFKALNL